MAIRASSDNLSLDYSSGAAAPLAPVIDFSEVWAHRESLRQACTRMIGDPSRAEDLVQETFLSALKSGRSLERRESIGPWLATVARRRSIDELRGRRKVAVLANPPEPEPTLFDDPAEQFLNQELVDQLRAAIAELTPRERQLLVRQATHGLSLSDLAAEEETSVASVRSVLTRARQKVRMSLERGGALGGLPIPRWLLNLRDKAARWAYLWEPTLPSLTGAGAQAVVAIVGAVALLIGGMSASTDAPDQSLTMIGTDSGAPSDMLARATSERNGDSARGSDATMPETPLPRTTPEAAAVAPLPGGIDVPHLPVPDSSDPARVYVGTLAVAGDGTTVLAGGRGADSTTARILRSFDGGRSWSTLGDNSVEQLQGHRTYTGGQLLIAPGYPTHPYVYARSSTMVQVSDDGGKTFTGAIPARGYSVLSPKFSIGDPVLFTSGSPAMAHRTDGTFQPLSPTQPTFGGGGGISPGLNYATNRELFVGGTTDAGAGKVSTLFVCTNGGCAPRSTLSGSTAAPHVVVSQARHGTVYAWTSPANPPRLYRSTDHGYTFSPIPVPTGVYLDKLVESNGRIFVHGVVAAGTSGASALVHTTTDGGTTWDPIGIGTVLQREGVADIVALTNGNILAAPRLSMGLYCSTDGGTTWAPRCP